MGRIVFRVALRKESVDRNKAYIMTIIICTAVALRKESVDRNKHPKPTEQAQGLSLSARRAWIEIGNSCTQALPKSRSPQGERG